VSIDKPIFFFQLRLRLVSGYSPKPIPRNQAHRGDQLHRLYVKIILTTP